MATLIEMAEACDDAELAIFNEWDERTPELTAAATLLRRLTTLTDGQEKLNG